MKPLAAILVAGLIGGISVRGAALDTAREAAAREDAEQSYRVLRSSVDDVLNSQADLRRRIDALAEAVQRVSLEARSRPGGDTFVTRQEFDKLVETVRELDRKREADKRQILEQIEDLGKTLSASLRSSAPVRVTPAEPGSAGSSANTSQTGVWYKVESGNTLSAIIVAHNAEFKSQGKKTSLQLILDANPGLKPTTMQVGRKIFVPLVPLD